MGNRVIREGINDSKKINALGFEAEVFYRRLFAVADDFGYFEADTDLLRSDLYKRLVDKITTSDIETWLNKCAEVGLIDLYEFEDKTYGQIIKFGQSLRIMRSKHPNKEGRYITKKEYIENAESLSKSKSASNGKHVSPESNPIETKGIQSETEYEEKPDLIKKFFDDFPNSSELERIAMILKVSKDQLIKLLPEFKLKANLKYENSVRFAEHFKNWYLKRGSTYSDPSNQTKTSITFPKRK